MSAVIRMAERTWQEAGELLASNQVVLVPVGAHEQHGPGIVLSTDTISATVLCERAAARLGDRGAVAPAVPYGVSWHHMRFPGTITLTTRTLATVLVEIATSLARHGFPRVVFVNGHGGNTAAIALAVEEAAQALPATHILGLYGYGFIGEQAREQLPAEAPGHGGGDEAAVVMAVSPAFARPAAFAAPGLVTEVVTISDELRAYGGASGATYDRLTVNGATGDTRVATADAGERILDAAGQRLAALLERWIEAHATKA